MMLIREYIYLYGAVCPKDGTCVYKMPVLDVGAMQVATVSEIKTLYEQTISLV